MLSLSISQAEAAGYCLQVSDTDGWVEIGETKLHSSRGDKVAILHTREIAAKIIYRVDLPDRHGQYYSVNYNAQTAKHEVNIDGVTYNCDVPAMEQSNRSNSEYSKYVGTWRWGSSGWIVEIKYNDGRYGFILNQNPRYYDGVSDIQEFSNSVTFVLKSTFDKRPELTKKGLSSYYDERDSDADPGYATSGEYHYNMEVCYYTFHITLTGDAPRIHCSKRHSYYYMNGVLVYADTTDDTAMKYPQKLTRCN